MSAKVRYNYMHDLGWNMEKEGESVVGWKIKMDRLVGLHY
jgi:hypothetical protein